MGRWEAQMGLNIECHRYSSGGSDLHLSRCKALTFAALGAVHTRHAHRKPARAGQSGFGLIPGFVYSTEI
jgi:hypothetical protein